MYSPEGHAFLHPEVYDCPLPEGHDLALPVGSALHTEPNSCPESLVGGTFRRQGLSAHRGWNTQRACLVYTQHPSVAQRLGSWPWIGGPGITLLHGILGGRRAESWLGDSLG